MLGLYYSEIFCGIEFKKFCLIHKGIEHAVRGDESGVAA